MSKNKVFNDIAIIGEIDIPVEALLHPNTKALESCLKTRCMTSIVNKPVLGTVNKCKTELYGWNFGLGLHTDNQGFIYLLVLNDAIGELYGDDYNRIPFKKGSIVKINDFKSHAVQQRGYTMALFIGSFEQECDEKAIDLLKNGLDALSKVNKNELAPRCHDQTLTSDYYL